MFSRRIGRSLEIHNTFRMRTSSQSAAQFQKESQSDQLQGSRKTVTDIDYFEELRGIKTI